MQAKNYTAYIIMKDVKTMNETNENTMTNEVNGESATATPQQTYASIEEYTQITGKRFRLLREEKLLGKSREQAFADRGLLRS